MLISKAADSDVNHEQENQMPDKINKADLPTEVQEYIEALEAAYEQAESENKDLTATVEKTEARVTELEGFLAKSAPKDVEAAEEIQKALLAKADPAVRALIEKQNKDMAELKKQADALHEAAQERVFLSKAEELPHIGDDKKVVAGLLRRIAEGLSAEDANEVEKILKAADAKIEQGDLFKSYGTDFRETSITKSVRNQAEELRKSHPELTVEQAEAQIYISNPELAAQVEEKVK